MSTRKKNNSENEPEGYEFDYENMPVGGEAADEEDGEDETTEEVDAEEMAKGGRVPEALSKEEVYKDILKNIKNDKICLYYACVGTTYKEGKPIYDNQLLVDLLINYGYSISYVLYAVDKLSEEPFYDNGESLMICLDRYRSEMYSDEDVKPLNSKIVKKLKKMQK